MCQCLYSVWLHAQSFPGALHSASIAYQSHYHLEKVPKSIKIQTHPSLRCCFLVTCWRDVLGVMNASGVISLGLASFERERKSAGTGRSAIRRRSGWEPCTDPFSDPSPSVFRSAMWSGKASKGEIQIDLQEFSPKAKVLIPQSMNLGHFLPYWIPKEQAKTPQHPNQS